MKLEQHEIESTLDLLDSDLNFIRKHFDNDLNGFWARSFIKTSVSLFEAGIYLQKLELVRYIAESKAIPDLGVQMLLEGNKYELKSNGSVKKRRLESRLKDDIKFVFNQECIIKNLELTRDHQDPGWDALKLTINVRNRLTHPKELSDQTVKQTEIIKCNEALEWFYENITGFMQQYNKELKDRLAYMEKLNHQL